MGRLTSQGWSSLVRMLTCKLTQRRGRPRSGPWFQDPSCSEICTTTSQAPTPNYRAEDRRRSCHHASSQIAAAITADDHPISRIAPRTPRGLSSSENGGAAGMSGSASLNSTPDSGHIAGIGAGAVRMSSTRCDATARPARMPTKAGRGRSMRHMVMPTTTPTAVANPIEWVSVRCGRPMRKSTSGASADAVRVASTSLSRRYPEADEIATPAARWPTVATIRKPLPHGGMLPRDPFVAPRHRFVPRMGHST